MLSSSTSGSAAAADGSSAKTADDPTTDGITPTAIRQMHAEPARDTIDRIILSERSAETLKAIAANQESFIAILSVMPNASYRRLSELNFSGGNLGDNVAAHEAVEAL